MRAITSIVTLILALTTGLSTHERLDREQSPYPYIQSAVGGRYYFRMTPPAAVSPDQSDWNGSGAIYEVRDGESDRRLWGVTGWYAFRTFLSYDGAYLVRLGNWPRGSEASERDLAVAFYRNGSGAQAGEGVEIKSYSTINLIEDTSKVQPTRSHYQFMRGDAGFTDFFGTIFQLVTVDGIRYEFDVRNGEILSKVKIE